VQAGDEAVDVDLEQGEDGADQGVVSAPESTAGVEQPDQGARFDQVIKSEFERSVK
jgi:hypothetical protein